MQKNVKNEKKTKKKTKKQKQKQKQKNIKTIKSMPHWILKKSCDEKLVSNIKWPSGPPF